jgi:hypothetical protein
MSITSRIRPGRELITAPRFHDQHPEGSITCEFNYPHAVAMLALGVPPGPRWLDSAAQQEPRVQALREKVSVERGGLPGPPAFET